MNKLLFGIGTCLILQLSSAFSFAGDLAIKHVDLQHFHAESFKRISDYICKESRPDSDTRLLTSPAETTGDYFVLSLSSPKLFPQNGSVKVHYITSQNPRIATEVFPLENTHLKGQDLWLGFTGQQAMQQDENIVAWKIEIFNADGQIVAEQQSFLWEISEGE